MQIGEAAEQFVFGYIRFADFAAGMVMTFGFLGRIYRAFFGNHHTRQLFCVPFWSARYWSEVWFEIRWYLFLAKEPKKYVGHNPLAQLAMFFFITLGVSFMIIHSYVAIREDIMSRQSIVLTMISGHRTFKDDRAD